MPAIQLHENCVYGLKMQSLCSDSTLCATTVIGGSFCSQSTQWQIIGRTFGPWLGTCDSEIVTTYEMSLTFTEDNQQILAGGKDVPCYFSQVCIARKGAFGFLGDPQAKIVSQRHQGSLTTSRCSASFRPTEYKKNMEVQQTLLLQCKKTCGKLLFSF